MGTAVQMRATLRHGKNVPRKNTMNIPDAEDIPLQAISMPRIDGSL